MRIYRGPAIGQAPSGFYWWTTDAVAASSADFVKWDVVEVKNDGHLGCQIYAAGTEAFDRADLVKASETFFGPLAPPDFAREVDDLQRMLLHILKGAVRDEFGRLSRAAVQGIEPSDVGTTFHLSADVLEIRKRIRELNPQACLYATWGGPMPTTGAAE